MQRTLLSNLMKASSPTPLRPRLGGHILVDQLLAQGVKHVFCVTGESYLAVLDGLHVASIQVTVSRQEGGAAMMPADHGKLTAHHVICMFTRGPGATNRSEQRRAGQERVRTWRYRASPANIQT